MLHSIPLRHGELTWEGFVQIWTEIDKFRGRKGWPKLNDSDSIMDIGSGSGNFLLWSAVSQPFTLLYGIELNPQRYELAKSFINQTKQSESRVRKQGSGVFIFEHIHAYGHAREILCIHKEIYMYKYCEICIAAMKMIKTVNQCSYFDGY